MTKGRRPTRRCWTEVFKNIRTSSRGRGERSADPDVLGIDEDRVAVVVAASSAGAAEDLAAVEFEEALLLLAELADVRGIVGIDAQLEQAALLGAGRDDEAAV